VLVIELCRGGSLLKFLIRSRVNYNSTPNYVNITSTLSHHQLLEMAVHVASGMAHLSAQKVIELL
jgi:serine/threonine protein kinase